MLALLAFDKFKNSMTAVTACQQAAAALVGRCPTWVVRSAPMTDGGEGFASILTAAVGGQLITVEVAGPRGQPQPAQYGLVELSRLPAPARQRLDLGSKGWLAVIEMAQAAGLEQLPAAQRDPWQTTTFGVGQLIRQAARERPLAGLLLGIGGSATCDLGAGCLAALGWRFQTSAALPVTDLGPAHFLEIGRIDAPAWQGPPVRIACDVDNPLFGPRGTAPVYGPQKGLSAVDMPKMESALRHLARLMVQTAHTHNSPENEPSSGAAGGIGFGLKLACPNARYLPGFTLWEEWMNLSPAIDEADLILTGEGFFDVSSWAGKGPGALLRSPFARKKTIWVLAGQIDEVAARQARTMPHLRLESITPPGTPLPQALAEGPANLYRAVSDGLETIAWIIPNRPRV